MILRQCMPRRAFTLAELLVAVVIAAFVVGATYAALSQVIRGRESVSTRQQAFARASLAAELIARDLEGALRDADLIAVKFAVVAGGSSTEPRDELILFSHHPSPLRPWTEQPEGAERESQYRIGPSGLQPSAGPATSLFRRLDPVPDETPDGGGLVSPLVDGVLTLDFAAADAESWYEEWDSDYDGIPHAVRVTVTATDDTGRATARARRTVAIDRVPAPIAKAYEEGEEEPATDTGTTTPSNGGGGTTGGGTTTGGGAGGGGGGATTGGGQPTTGGGGGGGGTTPR
jgi:type II secretion system protein J